MKSPLKILTTAVALSALFAQPSRASQDAPDIERPSQIDRKVWVFRTASDPRLRIEEVAGLRGFLGVGLLDLTPELRVHFGVGPDRGIMISSVVAGSPAERAGLLPADILTAADGEPLPASVDLSIRVARAAEGSEIELERWRDGRNDLLKVPVELRPRSQLDVSPLLVRRIEIEGHPQIEFRGEGDGDLDQQWVEEVVETVGDRFTEPNFIQQLEALRRERNELLHKLDQMEDRLKALESELRRLDSDRR